METTDSGSLFRREGRRRIFLLGLFLNSSQASKLLLVRDSIWSIAHLCLSVSPREPPMTCPRVQIPTEPTAVERELRSKEVTFVTEQRPSLAAVGDELDNPQLCQKNPLFYSTLSQPREWQGAFCCHLRSWLLVQALSLSLRRQRGGSRALIPAGTRVLGWPICRIILSVILAKSSVWDQTWPSSLSTVARASVVTVTGKEMEMFWGVVAQRVTSVAMGSLAEGFGVIHIATRLYSQKSMACQKNKWYQPGLWFGLIVSKLIFNLSSFHGHHNRACLNLGA